MAVTRAVGLMICIVVGLMEEGFWEVWALRRVYGDLDGILLAVSLISSPFVGVVVAVNFSFVVVLVDDEY